MPIQEKPNPKDKLKEVIDKLEQGIKDVFTSEKFKTYLAVMSNFHRYSFSNSLLIAMQRPDATYVAGYSAWQQKFKRHVLKGEKAIQILAPIPYKIKVESEHIDPTTQKPVTETIEVTKMSFKPVSVFDVSSTDGEPLPQLTTRLTGNVNDYDNLFNILSDISPVPIAFEQINDTINGYYSIADKRIAINDGMSEIQTVKTALHEIAHSLLHDVADKDAPTREIEAEAIAFIVSNHLGIDTSEYSFAYVGAWSGDKELSQLKSSLDIIQTTASDLIGKIESKFMELSKVIDEPKSVRQQIAELKSQMPKTTSKSKTKSNDLEV